MCIDSHAQEKSADARTEESNGGSRNFEKRGMEDNVSALSSFIANAHNELYAFYFSFL